MPARGRRWWIPVLAGRSCLPPAGRERPRRIEVRHEGAAEKGSHLLLQGRSRCRVPAVAIPSLPAGFAGVEVTAYVRHCRRWQRVVPGGHVEADETPAEAALREVAE